MAEEKIIEKIDGGGKLHLSNVLDRHTGEPLTYTETTEINSLNVASPGAGIIYRKYKGKFLKRNFSRLNVKWFGAKGDGITDDSAAFRGALAYIQSLPDWSHSNRTSYRLPLYVPTGVYNLQGTFNITKVGIAIVGDGKHLTTLAVTTTVDEVLFEIGDFSTSLADVYSGVQGFHLSGLRIHKKTVGVAGSRTGQAIRQTGGGDLKFIDVDILGFKYAINSVCGGDFITLNNVKGEYCDVGFYLGPGAQQVTLIDVDLFSCIEGLVLDRVSQLLSLRLNIANCKKASIVIEGLTNTSTRQLEYFGSQGTSMQVNLNFISTWLESNAGGMGDDYTNETFVLFDSSLVEAYRDITFSKTTIVSGVTDNVTPEAIIKSAAGKLAPHRVILDGTVFFGGCDYVFKDLGNNCLISSFRTAAGYTQPVYSNFPSSLRLIDKINPNVTQSFSLPITTEFSDFNRSNGIRAIHGINGAVSYEALSAGTWLRRFGFNVLDRKLYLDDPGTPTTSFSLSRSPVAPAGANFSFGPGSIVFNTNKDNSVVGWRCISTGPGAPVLEPFGLSGFSYSGVGSPEGIVFAKRGATYNRTDSGTHIIYEKTTDITLSTGWRNIDGDSVDKNTTQSITGTKTFKTINGVNDEESGLIHTFGSGGNRIEIRNAGVVGTGSFRPVIQCYYNNVPTTAFDANGLFDMKGIERGFRSPRLTTVQRDALVPTEGEEIYNLTLKKKQFFNGTVWETITSAV